MEFTGLMKGLMLAGGAGTRLRPITHTSAKQLVPVGNTPILFFGLRSLASAGIVEVGIVVGDTAPEIEEAVGDGSTFGLDVTYLPQDAPLGLAHAVLIAREYLGDEPFAMYLGDNFLLGGITDLVTSFSASDAEAQILLTRVSNPSQFGVAELDDSGQVIGLEEKPQHPRSDLALVGVYLFRSVIHDAVRAIAPSARGELEITEAIAWLIEQKHDVRSHVVTGYWKDTGRVEDLLECNRAVLEVIEGQIDGKVDADSELVGRVVVGKGAQVVRSSIRGPAIIGADARIVDTFVGPFTSLGDRCSLDSAEIEYSIVMADSSITGVRPITSSLIGRRAVITTATGPRRSHRLVIGDHSQVEITT